MHTLSVFSLCVSLLFLGVLLNMHLRKNSRLPGHDFDESEPMRLNKRHQNGQAPKGQNRSVLMDVFPRGVGAPLRCSFFQQVVKQKYNSRQHMQSRMCNVFSLQKLSDKQLLYRLPKGHTAKKKCTGSEKTAWHGNTKIILIESSDGSK